MSSFLLDTNVISELRRPRPSQKVTAWFQATPRVELYLSVIVLGEVRKGIELVRPNDPTQAIALDRWFARLEADFATRILPITEEIAEQWGRLASKRPRPITDELQAATALVHDLVFVTRNVDDISDTGAKLLNPFE